MNNTRKPNPIMQFFAYQHLPPHLKGVSQIIGQVATLFSTAIEDSAEKSAGLRKLLEAKDCFVRSALHHSNAVEIDQLSDGYHTFKELYAHRTNLFAVICNMNQPHAYKSKLHSDGSMYDGYFIAGIRTPEGHYSYHCDLSDWDLFDVIELQNAPSWDGHIASDIGRLHSLKKES